MTIAARKSQAAKAGQIIWTLLTGSGQEIRKLGEEAYEEVREDVRRRRTMLNDGTSAAGDDRHKDGGPRR
jgi:hypothetical protein